MYVSINLSIYLPPSISLSISLSLYVCFCTHISLFIYVYIYIEHITYSLMKLAWSWCPSASAWTRSAWAAPKEALGGSKPNMGSSGSESHFGILWFRREIIFGDLPRGLDLHCFRFLRFRALRENWIRQKPVDLQVANIGPVKSTVVFCRARLRVHFQVHLGEVKLCSAGMYFEPQSRDSTWLPSSVHFGHRACHGPALCYFRVRRGIAMLFLMQTRTRKFKHYCCV